MPNEEVSRLLAVSLEARAVEREEIAKMLEKRAESYCGPHYNSEDRIADDAARRALRVAAKSVRARGTA